MTDVKRGGRWQRQLSEIYLDDRRLAVATQSKGLGIECRSIDGQSNRHQSGKSDAAERGIKVSGWARAGQIKAATEHRSVIKPFVAKYCRVRDSDGYIGITSAPLFSHRCLRRYWWSNRFDAKLAV